MLSLLTQTRLLGIDHVSLRRRVGFVDNEINPT